MSARRLTAASILNETSQLVSAIAAPWAGVLLLTSLPFRLLQVNFVYRLIQLKGTASHYATALLQLALLTMAAYIVALVGRLVFVRACRLQMHTATALGFQPFRTPLPALFSAIYTGLFFQALLIVSSIAILPIPILALFKSLALVASERNEKISLVAPFVTLRRYTRNAATLAGILFTFFFALLASWINLYYAFQIAIWAGGGITGTDLTRWRVYLSFSTPLFLLLVTAGAFLAIEPFWLAAHVCYVARVQSQRSGEDLRRWFRELKSPSLLRTGEGR